MRTKPLVAIRGFLLISLLFFLVILSVGLLKLSLNARQENQRNKEKELLRIGHEYRNAIQQYYFYQNRRRYPANIEDLIKDSRFAQTVRFLRKAYKDPITGKPFKEIRIGPILVGVYSESQQEPLKKAHFDPDDEDFSDSDKYQYWTFTYPPHLLKVLPRNKKQEEKLDKSVNP